MDLSALAKKQLAADRRRGFAVDFATDVERHAQLGKDLIGLVGEVGEFANLLKKVSLRLERAAYKGPTLVEASPLLREELADTLIYLMRLSAILGGDLEQDVLKKMDRNDARYRGLESD
jgi:NTP pyrophosphatase (non-canonical NTP hydrolase)